jgi:DNA-binding ferritin-like protein
MNNKIIVLYKYIIPMKDTLCEILSQFKKAEYKIHVLHTSLQGEAFIAYHPFLWEIYEYLWEQIDHIMEDMEQLGYDVPLSLKDIINEKWEDEDNVIELVSNTENIKEQLMITHTTLTTLRDILQKGILESWDELDFVIQNNLIDYQKQIRNFERKIRRAMGKK